MSYTRATMGLVSGLVLSVVAVGSFAVGATRRASAEQARTETVLYRQPAYATAGPVGVVAEPVVYRSQVVSTPALAPAAVTRAPFVRTTSPRASTPTATRKRTSSWQKRAVVIGVSAGAGAGVGALIGGKKGALIGAAAGGGGATVVDLMRSR